MKAFLTFTSSLTLSALLLTAQAQTPATAPNQAKPAPKTADQRAAAYQGPKAVKDTKALGQKMVQKSKPADGPVRVKQLVPVEQK